MRGALRATPRINEVGVVAQQRRITCTDVAHGTCGATRRSSAATSPSSNRERVKAEPVYAFDREHAVAAGADVDDELGVAPLLELPRAHVERAAARLAKEEGPVLGAEVLDERERGVVRRPSRRQRRALR
jgi:hypothetical protein